MSNDYPVPASNDDTPEGYSRFIIERVEFFDDSITIAYGGRVFGGTMRDVLPPGIEAAIVPGAEVIFRYHTAETGLPGQVAHVLIRHPTEEGWAELYADWE